MDVHFIDIGGIVGPHFLNFLLIRPKLKISLFPTPDRLEPDLCCMNTALKCHCCKCNVEWSVGQSPVQKQFFLYQFQQTMRMCAQNQLPDMMSKFWDNLEGKKFPYLLTHWRNGGSGLGNEHIFNCGLIPDGFINKVDELMLQRQRNYIH